MRSVAIAVGVLTILLSGCAGPGVEEPLKMEDSTAHIEESEPPAPDSGEVPALQQVTVSGACDQAMRAAAAVPLDQANDAEFIVSTDACSSADEWASALALYPDALGISLDQQTIIWALQTACANAEDAGQPDTAVCVDARVRALF